MLSTQTTNNRKTALKLYFDDIEECNPLTPYEEVELAKKIENGDLEARNKLVEANLKFAVSYIKKNFPFPLVSYSDKIAIANKALITAAERFDYTRGFKFISYAVWWIRQELFKSTSDYVRCVRLPENVKSRAIKVRKIIDDHIIVNEGIAPSEDYIRKELLRKHGIEYSDNADLLVGVNFNEKSLDDYIRGDKEKSPLLARIENYDSEDPEEETDNESIKKEVMNLMIEKFDERELKIVKEHFGFNGREKSLEEIGDEIGLTRERVRQIKEKAVNKLRHKRSIRILRKFLD